MSPQTPLPALSPLAGAGRGPDPGPTIGSFCSGYGGLEEAVRAVFGGTVTWVADPDPGATAILAHHWPNTPNLGDITETTWEDVKRVDILCAGFPCQDISYAGLGAGIQGDVILAAGELECGCQWADHQWKTCKELPSSHTLGEGRQMVADLNQRDRDDPAGSPPERILQRRNRSGLWHTIADAIRVLRPRLIVLENVRAIVARRPGLDVVLADLARLGFHAYWVCVRASDVGAPHQRWRWFLLAENTDRPARGQRWFPAPGQTPGGRAWADAGRRGGTPAAHTDGQHAGPLGEGTGGGEPEAPAGNRGGAPADTESDGRDARRAEPEGQQRGPGAAVNGGSTEPACPTCWCPQSHHDAGGYCAGPCGGNCPDLDLGRPYGPWNAFQDDADPRDVAKYARHHNRAAAAHTDRDPVRDQPVSEPRGGSPAVAGHDGGQRDTPADTSGISDPDGPQRDHGQLIVAEPGTGDGTGQRADTEGTGRPDDNPAVLDWGRFGPAITRWERTIGRAAPNPTTPGARGNQRLNPELVEWMMGLPAGHVTAVPGLSHNRQLKALGNGVVSQQGAYALAHLVHTLLEHEGVAA